MLISILTALSRTPQPPPWTPTLAPLARRYTTAWLRHLAQRAEHEPLADALARIDVVKLTTKITVDALPDVGKLVALGRELRAALDSTTLDARDAIRGATAATEEPAFRSAIEQATRYVPMAEALVEHIDKLVGQILALVARLEAVRFVSDTYVLPAKPPGVAL